MNADSVKARLKNFAVKNGCTFQEALTYYGLERTIYRISVSKYAEQFVLKGGIFLHAVFDRRYERATIVIEPAGVGRNPYACRFFYVSGEKT